MNANSALYLILFQYLLNNTDETIVEKKKKKTSIIFCVPFLSSLGSSERDAKDQEKESDENSVLMVFLAHYTITTTHNGTNFKRKFNVPDIIALQPPLLLFPSSFAPLKVLSRQTTSVHK